MKGMNQRESRYVRVAKIVYGLTKQASPEYSHAKNPHHLELPQLAAFVLMVVYLNVSYRDMEEWLLATDKVCLALVLPRIPAHTTLQQTYWKLRKMNFGKMKNRILEEENIQEAAIASDSTGFSPGHASLYYQSRSGHTYEHWIKVAYAVGTESQYILSGQSGYGPSNDVAHLNSLKRGCARFGTHSECKSRGGMVIYCFFQKTNGDGKMERANFPVEFNNEIDDVKKRENEYYTLAVDRLSELAEGHHDLSGAAVNLKQPAKEHHTSYACEVTVVVHMGSNHIAATEKGGQFQSTLDGALDAVNGRFMNVVSNNETIKLS